MTEFNNNNNNASDDWLVRCYAYTECFFILSKLLRAGESGFDAADLELCRVLSAIVETYNETDGATLMEISVIKNIIENSLYLINDFELVHKRNSKSKILGADFLNSINKILDKHKAKVNKS